MKKRVLLAAALSAAVLFCACGNNGGAPATTAASETTAAAETTAASETTGAQETAAVSAKELKELGDYEITSDGSTLTFRAYSNPTTGYRWAAGSSDEKVISVTSDDFAEDSHEAGMTGVGGIQTIVLTAAGEGTAGRASAGFIRQAVFVAQTARGPRRMKCRRRFRRSGGNPLHTTGRFRRRNGPEGRVV